MCGVNVSWAGTCSDVTRETACSVWRQRRTRTSPRGGKPSPADRNPVDPVTWSETRVPAAAVVLETSAASRRSETHRIRQSVPGARLPLRRGGGAETLPSIFTRKHRHVGAQSPGMVKAVCRRPVAVSSIRMWASVVDRIWPPVGVFNRLSWDKQPPVWNENELWHQRKAQMFECKTLFSVDLKQIHERTTEASNLHCFLLLINTNSI